MTTETGLPSRVAAKVLRGELLAERQALRRLKDEARALSRLHHPSILQVHDLVVLEGHRVALITEYVEGEDLAVCLPEMGQRALLEALARVAWALDAAWGSELRLVHRDVKPSNIRLGRHGEVKLLDFGIARAQQMTREARTQTDALLGSPPYMAPERFLGPEAEPASDVFSLGCILFEAVASRRLFDQPVTVLAGMAVDPARYRKHLDAQLLLLPQHCPAPVRALIVELLQPDPAERPSARALAERMEALAETLQGPSLARFCRERLWAEPALQQGELTGRVFTSKSVEVPPAPRSRAALWALGLGSAGLMGAVGLGVAGLGLALILWWARGEDPVEPIGTTTADPSGNEAACLAHLTYYNALPCTQVKQDPRACQDLNDDVCDHTAYFRCRTENVWCEGEREVSNFAYSHCPDPCENKRLDAIGPAERACLAYVAVYNRLDCVPDQKNQVLCNSQLDAVSCDWERHYACLAERVYCNEDGRLDYRSGYEECRPDCR